MTVQNGTWKAHKLDELGFVGRGRSRHRPRNEPSLYGGAYPFFQTGDIKAAEFWLHEYSQTYNEKGLAQSKMWEPNTLCITIAANIAETAVLRIPGCFPDSVVGFVADSEKADVRFIKYCIDTLKMHMVSVADGTAQDNLSVDKLLSFDFVVPSVKQQRKISAVLSAYDELIENNRRRIQILEEMARLIYREWFVKFRFPGHEKVNLVDSPRGPIPEGWTLKSLGDVTENWDRKRKPLSKMQRADRSGPFPYYGAAKIFDYIDDYIFDGDYLLFAEDGSVITSERKPVLQFARGKFWANNHTHILQGKGDIATEFLYFSVCDQDISGYVTGAAQPKINQTNLNRIPVLMPDAGTLDAYTRIAKNTIDSIKTCEERNAILTKTRDLLLPRLISGEIDVSELDIEVPEEAA